MATTWETYFKDIKPRLGKRAETFQKIFDYLDSFSCPAIIETGTYREENNYTGDGCSTLLFDKYIGYREEGHLTSVDIDPKACALARQSVTTPSTLIAESDSVEFLGEYTVNAAGIDLLYLDSYNIKDWFNDWAPAAHHLKELFAAKNIIVPGTLIVVDDNIMWEGRRLGKGRLIYELMDSLGIEPYFDDYQIGWIWEEEYE